MGAGAHASNAADTLVLHASRGLRARPSLRVASFLAGLGRAGLVLGEAAVEGCCGAYRPWRAEQTVLYRAVREGWPEELSSAERRGGLERPRDEVEAAITPHLRRHQAPRRFEEDEEQDAPGWSDSEEL
jgi:hypothetical protein